MAQALARTAMLLIGAFFAMSAVVVRGWNITASPSDSYIVYASRDDALVATLHITALDRDESYPLDSNFDARSGFACSANGEHFAFMHEGQLHVISADGRHEIMNDLRGRRVHSLTISNDGTAAVVIVYSMSNLSIGIVRVPEGGIRWLSSGLYTTAPHLSYDDRTILVSAARNAQESVRDIYTMGMDASNFRRLLTSATEAVWKPNDHTLAYIGRNRNLYLTDLQRLLSVPLTRNGRGSYVFYPAWSPDGTRLTYLAVHNNGSELHLYVADANGKNARQLPTTGQVIDRGPCFLSFRPQTLLASASFG